MSFEFYNSVIEDECETYGLRRQMIKPAFKGIANAYKINSLKSGDTFVDYDDPKNRCAYLYKFAALHTSLVYQYFTKFLQEDGRKNILVSKQNLNICCLGGGPGTDIIGLFKALAQFPHFYRKVVKVVILDICDGWCELFDFIVLSLLNGKINGIPANFVDENNFEYELIKVDLLESLPVKAVEAIAAADIICSIKFVSAIYSDPASLRAMKIIAENIKPRALFFFIDNLRENIYELIKGVSESTGFEILLGPLHENFKIRAPKESKEVFDGIPPSIATKVSVIGMVKLEKRGSRLCKAIMLLNISDDSSTE